MTNDTLKESLIARVHQKANPWIILIAMVPVVIFFWAIAREPVLSVVSGAVPGYVFSGRLFSDPFDIGHAGFAMDQPTIGKWLFWFTATAVLSLPYALMVRWVGNRTTYFGYLVYLVPAACLSFMLMCILSWPLCWLIQYIHSMGMTPKRVFGLVYSIIGMGLVISFLWLAIRRPKKDRTVLSA